ncbi:MAG: hypothetical protein AB1806_10035 [Acidobacteriota bacterium]
MLQRQLRVGDIVDDYCPRERRVSDHAVVAMVGETIRQTRCTTCDAEHEYKNARVPVSRKKKPEPPLPPKAASVAAATSDPAGDEPWAAQAASAIEADPVDTQGEAPGEVRAAAAAEPAAGDESGETAAGHLHDGPVHRRLIRATLPRVEGQEATRPIPEFTMHRVPAGRAGFHGKSFTHGTGNQHRQGGRAGHGAGSSFGSRGRGSGQAHGRAGHRPQGGHGGRHGHQGPGAGSGRRKKH